MEKDYLVHKRASTNRPSGEWNEDDFDVLANGAVAGRMSFRYSSAKARGNEAERPKKKKSG
jgi:hypothetical protein